MILFQSQSFPLAAAAARNVNREFTFIIMMAAREAIDDGSYFKKRHFEMKKFIIPLFAILSSIALIALAEKVSDKEIIEKSLQVEMHQLGNGLKILTLEDHSAPVVSFQIWVHTGSKNERSGITGISHLFEHMMFKGSRKYGPEEHANIVKRHGGSLNAFTSEDVTVYFENIVSDKLELVISLEAERFANLALSDSMLASEREVVKEERRYRVDNSNFGLVYEELLAKAYDVHPYQWMVVGSMEDISAVSLENCKEYYRVNYAPNNIVAVIVGDFETPDAVKLVKKYFGKIPAQAPPAKVTAVEPQQTVERMSIIRKEAQLPMLIAGYHIPELSHEDIYPLKVLQKILSDGESSRLYQKLVYQEQVARYAGGNVDETENPGMFYVWMGMNKGYDIETGRKMLFDEIDRFAEEPVSEKELQKAKNQLEADFVFGLQTNSRKGMKIGFYQILAGDYEYIFIAPEKFRSVTAEDVMRVANQFLNNSNRTVVILEPEI